VAARCWPSCALSARRQDEPSSAWRRTCCSSARHARTVGAADAAAGRRAPGLAPAAAPATPIDYERERLGRFDPAWIAQARKRVAGAKDVWSAVAGGEQHRVGGLAEQFSLLGDSVDRLFPAGAGADPCFAGDGRAGGGRRWPARAGAGDGSGHVGALPRRHAEDGDLDQPDLEGRIRRLAQRIDEVRNGAEPQPLEPWMEELYRRVSDRQTMGSVVQELRASLSEVEKQIDQYFRNPVQRELLIPVPSQLSAMRGVLSVLGMDQASQAVLHMRDDVDALAQTEVDPQQAIKAGTFDRLADNLGALSFLIDMLSVQPQLAKSLFRFDPSTAA
jgi:chemosensory pili system protein ChpA (sensor histidine kinase/response regulator)